MAQTESFIAPGETVPSITHNLFTSEQDKHRVSMDSASSGFTWQPRVKRYEPGPDSLAEQLAEATPANTELLVWAGRPKNRPTQSWWDDTTDPFEPDND